MCSCDYAYYIVHKYHGHYQKKGTVVLLALLARFYSFRFSILLMHLYFTSMLRSGMSCWSLQCLHSWTSTIIYLSERKMNWLWEIVHVNCVYCHSGWIRGVAASIPCIGCCPHHTAMPAAQIWSQVSLYAHPQTCSQASQSLDGLLLPVPNKLLDAPRLLIPQTITKVLHLPGIPAQ
jgi:hypothetical protein